MRAALPILLALVASLGWVLASGRGPSSRLAEVEAVEPTVFEAGPSGSSPVVPQAPAESPPPAATPPAGAAEAPPAPEPASTPTRAAPTPEGVAAEAPAALALAPSSPAAPTGPADLPETPLGPLAALAVLAPDLATPAPPAAPPLRRAAATAGPRDPAAPSVETREVAGDEVNLRAGPSVGEDALGRLDAGDRVEVLGRTRDWLRVRAPSGEEGWVREDFLRAP